MYNNRDENHNDMINQCLNKMRTIEFQLLFSPLFSFCLFLGPSPWLACRDIWTLWHLRLPVWPPQVRPASLWLLLWSSPGLLFLFHRCHCLFEPCCYVESSEAS